MEPDRCAFVEAGTPPEVGPKSILTLSSQIGGNKMRAAIYARVSYAP